MNQIRKRLRGIKIAPSYSYVKYIPVGGCVKPALYLGLRQTIISLTLISQIGHINFN